MCIATVYVDSGEERKEAMRDVIRIEAENNGFRLVSLFGERKYIEGRVKSVDFWQEHSVLMEKD